MTLESWTVESSLSFVFSGDLLCVMDIVQEFLFSFKVHSCQGNAPITKIL